MHSRIAAGKLTDIAFDDEGKRILVAAKIVDDDEWQKVVEGVYTGFSQGGRYVKRWSDPETGMTRYTAEPSEISMVDVPCLPGATFRGRERRNRREARLRRADGRGPTMNGPRPPLRRRCRLLRRRRLLLPGAGKAALAIASAADKLEKAIEENSRLRAALGLLTPELAGADQAGRRRLKPSRSRRARRCARPRANGTARRRHWCGVDAAIKALSDLPEKERTMALMKVSLSNPSEARF